MSGPEGQRERAGHGPAPPLEGGTDRRWAAASPGSAGAERGSPGWALPWRSPALPQGPLGEGWWGAACRPQPCPAPPQLAPFDPVSSSPVPCTPRSCRAQPGTSATSVPRCSTARLINASGQLWLSAGVAPHASIAVSPTKGDLPHCPWSFVSGVQKRAQQQPGQRRGSVGKGSPFCVRGVREISGNWCDA